MFRPKLKPILHQYKSNFYLKSLQIKTDFSLYNKYFKDWHPRYFDVVRRTQYQKEKRDYKHLIFHSQDQLFFDEKNKHLNGGYDNLIRYIEREANLVMSPYKCIYLMYNMAKFKIFNRELFTRLDGVLDINAIEETGRSARYSYGALYAYYSFNLGRPENISFWERNLYDNYIGLHYFESLDLLNAISDSKLYPREHFDHQYKTWLYPSIMENFDKEFAHRQQTLYELAVSLIRFDSMDPAIWERWVNTVVGIKRIQNMEDFQKFLLMLLWCNETPKSPMFGKIADKIEQYKNQIRKNPNRFWKYDPDNNRFRTYQEMLKTSEDYDDNWYTTWPKRKQPKKYEHIKEEEPNQLADIKRVFKSLLDQKKTVNEIIAGLRSNGFDYYLVDEIVSQHIQKTQEEAVEKARKEGTLGAGIKLPPRKKKAPAAAAAPGKAGAAAGKKK